MFVYIYICTCLHPVCLCSYSYLSIDILVLENIRIFGSNVTMNVGYINHMVDRSNLIVLPLFYCVRCSFQSLKYWYARNLYEFMRIISNFPICSQPHNPPTATSVPGRPPTDSLGTPRDARHRKRSRRAPVPSPGHSISNRPGIFHGVINHQQSGDLLV